MTKRKDWDKLFPMDQPPTIEQIDCYAASPLWLELRQYLKDAYSAEPQPAYSRCGLEPGWNLKFKKGSRALTTVYFRPGYVTAMISIAPKDEPEAEKVLLTFTEYTQALYKSTASCKMGRWLMVDLTSPEILEDVKALLAIRVKPIKR